MSDTKADLHFYLGLVREAMLWKVDGLSEYDVRRPLTRTGTNLLGLVKHLGSVEVGYFADTFGRPFGEEMPWWDDDAEPNADLYATADESREQIVDFYRRAIAHADMTIKALELDSPGQVPWWPAERRDVTLGRVLVHVLAETNRHVGHADIVRELIDGSVGLRTGNMNLPAGDEAWWTSYREKVEGIAQHAANR